MRSFFSAWCLADCFRVSSRAAACQRSRWRRVYSLAYVELMPGRNRPLAPRCSSIIARRAAKTPAICEIRSCCTKSLKPNSASPIIQIWKDKAARDAYDQAAATVTISSAKLKSVEDAPDDERFLNPLDMTPAGMPAPTGAIYVVTHVDVIPPGKDVCLAALESHAGIDTAKGRR